MCGARTVVPGGNPLRLYTNVPVAAVMVAEASRVRFKVKVPVPRPFASALVMGGTSFAALSAALNTIVFGCVFDGDDGLLLPHPAASTAIPMSTYRFICVPPDYPVRVVPCFLWPVLFRVVPCCSVR